MSSSSSIPDFTNRTWLRSGDASDWCSAHPHNTTICDHVESYYQYHVDLGPNAAFLALFAASMVGFLAVWALTRRATAFNVAMLLGLVCEILGYAGRIINSHNPWDRNGFLVQICCLTIGPAFMAAGIYLSLRRIVTAFGPENSRIAPEYYTRIFIPCDVISLVLQALGGGIASVAESNNKSPHTGSNIMVVGLAFQSATMLLFILASADFAVRTWRRQRALGGAALDQRPEIARVRASRRFRLFLGALALSAVCILWRSAFRVAELSEGWRGRVMGDQGMFIGFEGVLIVVAVVPLNVFHPAYCMRELLDGDEGGLKGLWFLRGRKQRDDVELSGNSTSESERKFGDSQNTSVH